jgi:hypothetical protein
LNPLLAAGRELNIALPDHQAIRGIAQTGVTQAHKGDNGTTEVKQFTDFSIHGSGSNN